MSQPRFVAEAEAYGLLERAGLRPPRHALASGPLPFTAGDPVVVKGLGDQVWHKSELGAVAFLPFDERSVLAAVDEMRQRIERSGHRWIDGLVCERIAIARNENLPSEGFVSLARGEAGWTVLLGFGGLQAEALAELAPPLRWSLEFTRPEEALREFEAHLLGRTWLGALRGANPLSTRELLSDFFTALWKLAALAESEGLVLLELNPLSLDEHGQPRPLDALGQRGTQPAARLAPPAGFLAALHAPRRIALVGVSAQEGGFGRTILENLRRYALPHGDLVLVKPGMETFLGLPSLPDVRALEKVPVDLLIIALPAPAAASVLSQLLELTGGATVVALVSGGIGDGADTAGFGDQLARALCVARAAGRWTPAVLGPNFLGHWVPGRQLDTCFIPAEKLAAPNPAGGELTLLSQSGAFLLSRRSRQPALRFGFGLALGNQLDVALCDVLTALAAEAGRGPIAAYVEGFGTGQLLPAAHAIHRLCTQGRLVLIHRAGRTAAGQVAAASHTGAMASDFAVEHTLLERAGAKFTDTITDFDSALNWLSAYPQFVSGPVALVTNAGFESVNGGDLFGAKLPAAVLDAAATQTLRVALAKHELAGLVSPRLPLDLTPMADEAAFLSAVDVLLANAAVVVVGFVPFTRRLDSSAGGGAMLADALAQLRNAHAKPVGVVIDAGPEYEDYRRAFDDAGLPVFARMENALVGLQVLA